MDHDEKTSTALVRKRNDMELMPPPPAPKRIKRPKKIIDEDSYTDALSQIIARDFFPGLLESETQQEYLDAIESKDEVWISSASRRLQQVMTPGRRRARRGTSLAPGAQTPRGFVGDTPISVSSESTTSFLKEKDEIDTNMSLGAFQSKYTSEDNESFYKLLDKQNLKKAEKYAWLWTGNKLPSKMQLKQKQIEAKLMETRSLTDDGFKKDRLAIKDRDERPSQPTTKSSAPKNSLMFIPEGIEESMVTRVQKAEAESRAAPRGVNYENTRLPGPKITDDESVPSSPSLSAVRDAIAGKRGTSELDSTTVGSETPRVNGYAFVDDEEPEYEAPTAPKIDLGPGDSTPNPFIIKEQSKREALHHRMVDRISQSKRTSSKIGLTGRVDITPVPKFPSSPRVTAGLTPAAQRLWSKIGGSGGSTPRTPFGQSSPMRGRSSKLKHVTK
ncbi:nuclear protein DGCR14 [Annulohypoxylon maeteangense]|uniref:nuclear protein DGCR14 n=1 Tax=Annulohypoxylon maeteangense TaxID=1927788 RepID=UPI0020072B0D|nr:nuclear protein DGCR14 [Annulohypoxylon maeteangense]KAI0885213.1 nuclear protein DGCR14 [Annulohypoxylon maeteangense]